MKKITLLFFFLCLVSGSKGFAALYVDDTYTVDKGKGEIDLGFDYVKDIKREFDCETEEFPKTICKETQIYTYLAYGLTGNWEINLYIPYEFSNDTNEGKTNGFEDVSIGTKYRFFEEKRLLPSVAASFDLKTESANEERGLGTGGKDLSLAGIFTKVIGRKTFDLNLGYTFAEGKLIDVFYYVFDLTYDLTDKLSLCNEVYGEKSSLGGFSKNASYYGVSFSYDFSEVISFDSGVSFGLTEISSDYQFSNSLTFSF